jgi:hypothetical protein
MDHGSYSSQIILETKEKSLSIVMQYLELTLMRENWASTKGRFFVVFRRPCKEC